ncbi:MAG: AGE family epimerase/isomerase [Candidatus Hodarchaeota archaeon]
MTFSEEYQESKAYYSDINEDRLSIALKNNKLQEDSEAYFPNFLYYSITLGNALIDYLYDNATGGFYRATDQSWAENSLDRMKYVYDQAQTILGLLRLSKAVINQTESDFALSIAESTANYLITNLYDSEYGGFFLSNWETYKKPGIQGKAIQALLELYSITDNHTYREIALSTYDFIEENGWDDSNNGYYYLMSHTGFKPEKNPFDNDPYSPKSKRVDHNVIMGEALLDLYQDNSDPSYLLKATDIYEMLNNTCRNQTSKLFYTGYENNGSVIDLYNADSFINSLVLEFLARLYKVTNEENYYNDFFILLKAFLLNFWDNRYGGFHATYSYLNEDSRDKKKYTERQFYAIRALDEAYQLSNDSLYYNLILDIMEFVNDHLYDNFHEGYYQLTNDDGSPGDQSWNHKYTVVQALAVYELANLWLYSKPGVLNALWSPTTPRPEDPVTILIAAFDADGVSNVLLNYSLNDDPYLIKEMVPHHLVGNMYNSTLDAQPDGTRINFNIIVNDTLGNEVVRGNYFFLWQHDLWSPHVELIGIDPGTEIPVNTNFSLTVTAHDTPSQGEVISVRMYYHAENGQESSRKLDQIDVNLWSVEFSTGFSVVSGYAYRFEAIDDHGNIGYSDFYFIQVLGHLETLDLPFLIGAFFIIIIVIPTGIYTYVEYKKKNARRTLKVIHETRKHRRRRGKRGRRVRS